MILPVLPEEPAVAEPASAPPFLVEVAFKGHRRAFFRCDFESPPPLGAAVLVEVDRGEDFARVHATGALALKRNAGVPHGVGTGMPAERILRLATPAEVSRERDLRLEDDEVRRKAIERVRVAQLELKVSDAEWQFDRKKLTLYFTAEKRIDFRALVRDLATRFRTRIELKQYGVRDEAKRLSGIGRCGREYCSAAWLPELRPVNLGVAKEQKLSLNPSQISGACGRLMCCLRYEHDFYVAARKRFPKEGRILVTDRGEEKVVALDIFRDRVTLRNPEGEQRIAELADILGAPTAASSPAEAPAAPERAPGRAGERAGERASERAPRARPRAAAAPQMDAPLTESSTADVPPPEAAATITPTSPRTVGAEDASAVDAPAQHQSGPDSQPLAEAFTAPLDRADVDDDAREAAPDGIADGDLDELPAEDELDASALITDAAPAGESRGAARRRRRGRRGGRRGRGSPPPGSAPGGSAPPPS